MGLFSWFRRALSPGQLTSTKPVAGARPLWDQFQRIGGGIGPLDVSAILQEADSGQPARLVDLYNESREKDGHLQSVASTRERAVSLCELSFVLPENVGDGEKLKDKKSRELCQRIVAEFENWHLLVEHLTASFNPGHATAEILWKKTKDGLLLPYKAKPIHQRDFIFRVQDGALRYSRFMGDALGVDLLEENPGRIVQIQRRIVGDVAVREGLIRILVWAALLRNWSLRDWVALGEIGWKPWRIGKYKKQGAGMASQQDINDLVVVLERIGATGAAAVPDTTELQIEWPKGMAPGTGGSSTHRELFDALAREMSKAVLGQTTIVEPGPNGDRAGVEARDALRIDIRESDAIAVAAALRAHLFAPAVAVNMSDGARVPVPWFQTDEAVDQFEFAQAVEKLVGAGVRIPAKWVRDEVGMPEPKEGEEVLEPPKPTPKGEDPNDPDGDEEEKDPAEAA